MPYPMEEHKCYAVRYDDTKLYLGRRGEKTSSFNAMLYDTAEEAHRFAAEFANGSLWCLEEQDLDDDTSRRLPVVTAEQAAEYLRAQRARYPYIRPV